MNAMLIDRDGTASRLAAEGKFALGTGETTVASQKYEEAGTVLESSLAPVRKPSDLHLLRFLAATQYYHGGHYSKALKLASRIETRFLPTETQKLLPEFLKDARERSDPDYVPRMRQHLVTLWQGGKFQQVLNVLKDHPYLYEQGLLAFLRAVLCEELRQWKAAAAFYAAAIPGVQDGSDFMLMAVGRALRLPSEGRVDEAWEYIRRLREKLPNAVTNIVASITCFHVASKAVGEERLELYQEQIRYFNEGWDAFQRIPVDQHRNTELRNIMSLCFDAAVMASMRLDDYKQARALIDVAIKFEPNATGPLVARGMLNYTREESLDDFHKAISLPNPGYVPFLYLAHHAFHNGQMGDAERLCREALARRPAPVARAQLLGWLAVFRDCLNASQEEVEALFKQALEIDPGNQQVAHNYAMFKEEKNAENRVKHKQWDTQTTNEWGNQSSLIGNRLTSNPKVNNRIREMLLEGAA